MEKLKIKLISSTGATTNFNELSMYGNHIIGYAKDLRDLESKKLALELDMIQDNLLEKDYKLIFLTTSTPEQNETIRQQLGFVSPIYTISKKDVLFLGTENDLELITLEDKDLSPIKTEFTSKGIATIGK